VERNGTTQSVSAARVLAYAWAPFFSLYPPPLLSSYTPYSKSTQVVSVAATSYPRRRSGQISSKIVINQETRYCLSYCLLATYEINIGKHVFYRIKIIQSQYSLGNVLLELFEKFP